MITIKALILARKIHRLFVLLTSVIVLIMATTGIILKYPIVFSNLSFVDIGLIRFLHNSLSPYFAFILLVMVVTGLILYIGPKIISRNRPA